MGWNLGTNLIEDKLQMRLFEVVSAVTDDFVDVHSHFSFGQGPELLQSTVVQLIFSQQEFNDFIASLDDLKMSLDGIKDQLKHFVVGDPGDELLAHFGRASGVNALILDQCGQVTDTLNTSLEERGVEAQKADIEFKGLFSIFPVLLLKQPLVQGVDSLGDCIDGFPSHVSQGLIWSTEELFLGFLNQWFGEVLDDLLVINKSRKADS